MVKIADVRVDAADEHRRIDAAIDAKPIDSITVEAVTGCHACGSPPGSPCVSQGPGQPILGAPHQRRVDDYRKMAAAVGSSLATTPDTSEVARRGLQQAIRVQILAFCEQEITAKTLSRLQRFCASMGQAMLGLEKPDALVRDRFGRNSYMSPISFPPLSEVDDGAGGVDLTLAGAPAYETYGANASRGLIAEAAKIGKDIIEAQTKARTNSSLPELVASLVLAKKQKLPKNVVKALERQIDELAAPTAPTANPGGL